MNEVKTQATDPDVQPIPDAEKAPEAVETSAIETPAEKPAEETPAEEQSQEQVIMTIGGDEKANIVEHTVSIVQPIPDAEKNTVTVSIAYPKGYKKDKFFKDNDLREVSAESAALFVKQGIATLIEDKK